MPTPEQQDTVESQTPKTAIIGSVINKTNTVSCPVVDQGTSSGGGSGKGDPVEPDGS